MKHHQKTCICLSITLLVISSLACKTLTKAFPTEGSTAPSTSGGQNLALSMDWLVTADDLNSFTADIGIIDWKSIEDTPGENRICRSFQGVSWSVSPNEGLNCIFKVASGSSFQSVIDGMIENNQLMSDSQPVESSLNLDGEFAVYAGTYPNGHGVFDLILVKDGLMYWSSVTVGTQAGATPLDTYSYISSIIDTFLAKIISINQDRIK